MLLSRPRCRAVIPISVPRRSSGYYRIWKSDVDMVMQFGRRVILTILI